MRASVLLLSLLAYLPAVASAFFLAISIATRDPSFALFAAVLALFAVSSSVTLVGLGRRRRWARLVAITVSVVNLFGVFVLFAIFSLVDLFSDRTRTEFNEPVRVGGPEFIRAQRWLGVVFATIFAGVLTWCFIFGNGLRPPDAIRSEPTSSATTFSPSEDL